MDEEGMSKRKTCKQCAKFITTDKEFCNDICVKFYNTDMQKEKILKGKTKCEKCYGSSSVIDTKYLNQKKVQRTLKCNECQHTFKKKYNVEELPQRKKIIPKKCPNCQQYFVKEKQYATDKAICCSRKCMKELWQKIKYDRYKRKCLNCNKTFSKRRQVYCSRECSAEASVKNKAWRPTGNYVYQCVVCERDFSVKKSVRGKVKTCSDGCKHISAKGYPSHLWKKFQDENYRKKYSHINKLLKGYELRNQKRWQTTTNLSVEYLIDILPVNNKCPIFGYDLHFEKAKKNENKLSLDRINNKKSYEKGNVMWMSLKANCFKNDLNKDELYKFCKFWLNYNDNEVLQGLSDTHNQS